MLRSLKDLRGYTVHATDGDVGKVHDVYFDDQIWMIRYLVVNAGNRLMGRQVLISTISLGRPGGERQLFPVSLTKEQMERAPDIDTDRPVSRQARSLGYYGWSSYWSPITSMVGLGDPVAIQVMMDEAREAKQPKNNPHLRSVREVIGYRVQATDGESGYVKDFIIDDETWKIRHMVMSTRNWISGKKVLVDPRRIKKTNWTERKIYISLPRKTINDKPEFDPSVPVNQGYELRLYDYYGRPTHWERL
jgi:sporulation protein YlmC with PRC-barrel domain